MASSQTGWITGSRCPVGLLPAGSEPPPEAESTSNQKQWLSNEIVSELKARLSHALLQVKRNESRGSYFVF